VRQRQRWWQIQTRNSYYTQIWNTNAIRMEEKTIITTPPTTVNKPITYNGKMSTNMTMPTNMMKFKCSKYSCLRVFNIDDSKIIDWICTKPNIIFQSEPNKHRT
jgi:hypothetical protein